MKLAEATWQDVEGFDKEAVVVIPTGALEQHGPHLPLITDSLIVEAVAQSVEARVPTIALLTPCIWLGASDHHLTFPGSLSADGVGYRNTLRSIVLNLSRHGFNNFFVLNGHGGNNAPNALTLRELKKEFPNLVLCHTSYFELIEDEIAANLKGPLKHMRHGCEAETSLVLHLRPDLVRMDKVRDDGLQSDPPIPGLVVAFEQITDEGSVGFSTQATAETGKAIFEAAVNAVEVQIRHLAMGPLMVPIAPSV